MPPKRLPTRSQSIENVADVASGGINLQDNSISGAAALHQSPPGNRNAGVPPVDQPGGHAQAMFNSPPRNLGRGGGYDVMALIQQFINDQRDVLAGLNQQNEDFNRRMDQRYARCFQQLRDEIQRIGGNRIVLNAPSPSPPEERRRQDPASRDAAAANPRANLPPHVPRNAPVDQNGGQNHNRHHLKTVEVPKYSGSAENKTPFDFIVELEKYKTISRSDENYMLQEIVPAALEGSAYHWYRHEITLSPFESWVDFKNRFRREFQALGYLEELNRELEARTQGPSESLTVFIRVILDYYERLGRPSTEEEKVNRIMRQMHPEYLQVLQGKVIRTIRDLKEAAFQAQDIIKAYRMYRPPPTFNCIEPSLAWKPVEKAKEYSRTESMPIPISDETPKVHFSAVDPYRYYHGSPKKQVSFAESRGGNRQQESAPPNRSNTPPLTRSFVQTQLTPPRERSNSGGVEGAQRRCYECNSADHLRNNCPKVKEKAEAKGQGSPRPGNSPAPSPRR